MFMNAQTLFLYETVSYFERVAKAEGWWKLWGAGIAKYVKVTK